ncbi:unnamed protein product [Pleuronectes platessa]|uniref:Uncharacterized protein n=1 Tax=Pleuronectes platessa TaxID=8262 RepID=A0A9N7YZJ5_PLEPL|nr:unnamed protein product [Pleuronectes platessa]
MQPLCANERRQQIKMDDKESDNPPACFGGIVDRGFVHQSAFLLNLDAVFCPERRASLKCAKRRETECIHVRGGGTTSSPLKPCTVDPGLPCAGGEVLNTLRVAGSGSSGGGPGVFPSQTSQTPEAQTGHIGAVRVDNKSDDERTSMG